MPDPVVFNHGYYSTNDYVPQHVTVDVSGLELGKAGANLSSRMVLTVEDEAGGKVKGFFTANEYIDWGAAFSNRFKSEAEKPGNEQFRPVYDKLREKFQNGDLHWDEMFKGLGVQVTPEGVNNPQMRSKYLTKIRDIGNKLAIIKSMGTEKAKGLMKVDEILSQKAETVKWLSDKTGIAAAELGKMSEDPMFWHYMAAMTETIIKTEGSMGAHVEADRHAQSLGGNINKRNNAMYDYASALGEPELLARSSSMTLTDKGQKIHGSFMANAKGVERESMYKAAKEGGCDLVITGSGLRELSKLQVVDYLCGNYDRHQNNMFYQVEKVGQEMRIIGVQGIDNDASFGAVKHEGTGTQGYMSHLEDIKIIDGRLAREILTADYSKIEERMRLAELSAREINAARRRFSDLQKRIRSGKVEIVFGQAAWDKKIKDDPKMNALRYNNGAKGANIFQIAKETCDSYNLRKTDSYLGAKEYEAPVGKASAIVESGSLDNQLEQFTAMQKKLAGINDPDIAAVKVRLDNVVETLGKFANGRTGKAAQGYSLNDLQRNFLSERLKSLADHCEQYAGIHKEDAGSSSGAVREGLNSVKNLAAFSRFSRESVQKDAMEQEKNAASYQADSLSRENKADKGATFQGRASFSNAGDLKALNEEYADLRFELASVDSAFIKSSPQFKKMMAAFNDFRNAPDKDAALARLTSETQKYIDYKTKAPEGKKPPKLSDYAKKRVEYAQKILDFSNKAAEYVKPAYQEQAQELVKFHNQCAKLINDYVSTRKEYREAQNNIPVQKEGDGKADEEKIRIAKERSESAKERALKAENAVLGAGEFFRDGMKKLADASKSYGDDHSMQLLCHTLLAGQPNGRKSSIGNLVELHARLTDEKKGIDHNAENAAKTYESLGITHKSVIGLTKKLENTPIVRKKLAAEAAKIPSENVQEKKKGVKM